MFFEEHAKLLSDFARVSQAAGARADYVQGGGGNTSVKLPGGLMAIKASGFCLSDIRPDKAYAVLDGADLRNFYLTTEPSALADVEKEGSARAKADIRHIDGLADLRPSVEAGFHSILKTFVVHTHSVYANLAACSTACRPIAAQAFAGANYTWGWVPYTDPGANLTFAIRDELRRVEKETGKVPSVILMQNHGIMSMTTTRIPRLRFTLTQTSGWHGCSACPVQASRRSPCAKWPQAFTPPTYRIWQNSSGPAATRRNFS